tara:strand:- start:42 stop:530 length:489 start_codon:yes stop_codon:yes gene_type:complete
MAGKYDDMTFKKAFVAARKAKGAGKVFTWKGKRYTTNTKEDEAKKNKKVTKPKIRPKSGAPKKSLKPKKRPGSGEPPVAKPSELTIKKVTVAKLPAKGPVVGRSLGEREAFSKRMARIEKKMKKDFGDSPSLIDDIMRAIRNFRKKNPSPGQVRNKKDPRNK